MDSETVQRQFLETVAKAYPHFLNKKGSRGDYYLHLEFSEDGTQILEVEGFRTEFYPAHRDDLTISAKDFFNLASRFFREAPHAGNYYIEIDAIKAFLDDPESQSTFALVSTQAQFTCDIFMVMPFREHLDPVYTDHIMPIAEGMNLVIKRGDDPFSEHDIITEIWSFINNCDLVIADCTGQNPNVFYEMGLAHAIGKPVIPITQNIEDIPFDIRQRRFIEYDNTPRGMQKFEADLKQAIEKILGEG